MNNMMKRGNTGKLIYDFNTAANLEVQIGETWYRVTARDFRSYNGARRVNEIPYEGLIYMYNTNLVIKNPPKPGIVFGSKDFPQGREKKLGIFI